MAADSAAMCVASCVQLYTAYYCGSYQAVIMAVWLESPSITCAREASRLVLACQTWHRLRTSMRLLRLNASAEGARIATSGGPPARPRASLVTAIRFHLASTCPRSTRSCQIASRSRSHSRSLGRVSGRIERQSVSNSGSLFALYR